MTKTNTDTNKLKLDELATSIKTISDALRYLESTASTCSEEDSKHAECLRNSLQVQLNKANQNYVAISTGVDVDEEDEEEYDESTYHKVKLSSLEPGDEFYFIEKDICYDSDVYTILNNNVSLGLAILSDDIDDDGEFSHHDIIDIVENVNDLDTFEVLISR
jgi:hypothetical protein